MFCYVKKTKMNQSTKLCVRIIGTLILLSLFKKGKFYIKRIVAEKRIESFGKNDLKKDLI